MAGARPRVVPDRARQRIAVRTGSPGPTDGSGASPQNRPSCAAGSGSPAPTGAASGSVRSVVDLGDRLVRLRLLGRPERHQVGDPVEVGPERLERRRRVQRGRRVIQRVQAHRARPDHPHLLVAVQPRDPGAVGAQELRREVPERADDRRLDQVHLAAQVVLTGLDLVRVRVAVVRGPAFEDIAYPHLLALEPDLREQLVEQLARLADERKPHPVLVGAGRLADEHQIGIRVAGAEDDRGARLMQGAAHTAACFLVDGPQQLASLESASH